LNKYLSRPGKTNRLDCWATLEQSLHKWHPLFEHHSSKLREYLKTQIGSRYGLEAAKVARDHSTANKNIQTYGDLGKFIEDYRINYQKLQAFVEAGHWVTSPFVGENDADNVATCLFKLGVLKTPVHHRHTPHRCLVVLDHDSVPSDTRWQQLHHAPDSKHRTGPDTKGRTMVFSSIGLLGNLLSARPAGWEICASTDGTHGMSNTNHTLICFGVLGNNCDGSRTFFPVAYGWGEGEREIVALHSFLNIKFAMSELYGVNDIHFKGGIISDHAHSLMNALKAAFPEINRMQGYTHIVRKFISPWNRKGNGSYITHSRTKNSKWVYKEARRDINRLHHCKTKQQFECYADLMSC
jgi:hypothetical protein